MRHTLHLYVADGEIRHVVASTGELPGEPIIEDSRGALTLLERELDHGRQLEARELREALELSGGNPRIKASAAAELRGLVLRDRVRALVGEAFSDGTGFDNGTGFEEAPQKGTP